MIIRTNTNDRKALASAIAEELGTTSRYLRTPSCAYQIGGYTLDREGNLIGEDFGPLHDFLCRHGYIAEAPASNQEAPEQTQPAEKEPADSEAAAPETMEISIPAQNVTAAQVKNLIFTLYARQTLVNRMCESDCLNIPDILIQRLQENTPESLEDLTSLLDDSRAVAGLTGFEYRDGKVSMTFPFDETQPTRWTAYANLLNRIFDAAMKATRVFPERVEANEGNEKYLAHTWLQRLGYRGADFKAERKILLGHLSGYCAFKNDDKMQEHKDKYAAIRREYRISEQESAVLTVMEEATENE